MNDCANRRMNWLVAELYYLEMQFFHHFLEQIHKDFPTIQWRRLMMAALLHVTQYLWLSQHLPHDVSITQES